jgi:cyclohexa-1,5-dienecarbonyl-CoA hydratase
LARAEEMLLTGRSITADEAKTFGLVTDVFETRADLDTAVEEWIQKHILPKSAVALRFAERAVRAKFNHILSNFLPALETMYLRELMNTHDANEGIQSFVEKRKPEWTNN